MPCPYFQPRRVASDPRHIGARLPLIEEYDGLCHASGAALAVPPELRFPYCNHGYSRGSCDRFPAGELRSGIRYTVVRRTPAALEILYVEEQNYVPLAWHSIQYFPDNDRLEPQLSDECIRAQLVAFCHSYLKRFSA